MGSAASFGLSGPLARGLLEAGWSPGAVVLARIALGAAVVAPFAVRALAGRWGALRTNAVLLLAYGSVSVAGAQFAYFSAVARMDVGPALLIEYTAPVALVGWTWVRHGARPDRRTVLGAVLAMLGLVLVLDLLSGADLAVAGVGWALVAMVGAATYFVLSAGRGTGLPATALAAGGLAVGAVELAVLGAVGVLPMRATTATAVFAGEGAAWWLPIAALGILTAGVAYPAGIGASRRLGSRVASFVGLLEVLAGVLFAWLLLGQLPGAPQLLGGALVLAGVVTVERASRARIPGSAAPEAARPAAVVSSP